MNPNNNLGITEAIKNLAYLTKDFMPVAVWTVEGIFRHDRSIYQLLNLFSCILPARRITHLSGAVPCLWSLDWFEQRRPMGLNGFVNLLNTYTKIKVGVILEFDNPFIREEDLTNAYALSLVSELCRRDPHKIHAVSVASDMLADHLRTLYPNLTIHCHVNRLFAADEGVTRDAAYYDELLTRYQRVTLHPNDAVNPDIFTAIKEIDRVDIVTNDTCLRTCSLRKEHLLLLDSKRRNPYGMEHMNGRVTLQQRAGCNQTASAPGEKLRNNLTKKECRALYEAGYRSFIIQGYQFRNEITLMWDIFQCMFAPTPEITNKLALITVTGMGILHPSPKIPASGLKGFSSLNYD